MSHTPTLIVDRVQADQILDAPCDHADCDVFHAAESVTVRVDGPLPTVTYAYAGMARGSRPRPGRPLRVDDRVALATDDCECRSCMYGNHPHPFATATVAKVWHVGSDGKVQMTDEWGQPFKVDPQLIGIKLLPATNPGDWLVAVTDVEAL